MNPARHSRPRTTTQCRATLWHVTRELLEVMWALNEAPANDHIADPKARFWLAETFARSLARVRGFKEGG